LGHASGKTTAQYRVWQITLLFGLANVHLLRTLEEIHGKINTQFETSFGQ
jgi:hypothetical protein